MIRFSWMLSHSLPLKPEKLLQFTEELDDKGYHSILLTVHSRASDYIPIVSSILNNKFKIKYMLAVRPYLLSPQYFMMLVSGINSISKDRIMINWVHGNLGTKENFNSVLNLPENFNDSTVRRNYMYKFLKTLDQVNMFSKVDIPESLISSSNKEVLDMIKEFDMNAGTGYDVFLKNYKSYEGYNFKKIFLSASVIIRNTDEEAFMVAERSRQSANIIYGSAKTVENEIIRLNNLGVTDLLVSPAFDGGKEERERIHMLVSSMIERGLAV